MDVPKEIQIGPHTYSIELCDCFTVDGNDWSGEHDYANLHIRVATRTSTHDLKPYSVIEVTMWHEFIHAIARNYSLTISEESTDNLAHGIVQILNQLDLHVIKGV